VVDHEQVGAEQDEQGQVDVEHRGPGLDDEDAVEGQQATGQHAELDASRQPPHEQDGEQDHDGARHHARRPPADRSVAEQRDARGDEPLPERWVDREPLLDPAVEDAAGVLDVVHLVEDDPVRLAQPDGEQDAPDEGADDGDRPGRQLSGHAIEPT
jgi:hypothetical protein